MLPNLHIHEQLMFERAKEWQQAIEQRHLLKELPRQRFRVARHVAAHVRTLLITLGMRLNQLEPSARPVPSV